MSFGEPGVSSCLVTDSDSSGGLIYICLESMICVVYVESIKKIHFVRLEFIVFIIVLHVLQYTVLKASQLRW